MEDTLLIVFQKYISGIMVWKGKNINIIAYKTQKMYFQKNSIFLFMNLVVNLTFVFFLTASDLMLLQLFLLKSINALIFWQLCASVTSSS